MHNMLWTFVLASVESTSLTVFIYRHLIGSMMIRDIVSLEEPERTKNVR